jgi:Ca2+-transporting ATPase
MWEAVNSPDGTTMAFLTLSMAEIFHSFNMRSRRGSIFKLTNRNKWLWAAGIAAFVLTTMVIYVPFLSAAFEFEHISLVEYAIAIALGALMIPMVELVKFIQRKAGKGEVK